MTSNRDTPGRRPRIAFFDAADVFEDFYPHYGVDHRSFASTWTSASGNHAFIDLFQREIGDVTWYQMSIRPTVSSLRHSALGFDVRFLRSPLLHRWLWRAFYLPSFAWRWRGAYRPFATVASYAAVASPSLIASLRRERTDVIFLQDYFSGRFDTLFAISRLLRIPLIAYHSGSTPDRYLSHCVRRLTLPRADLLIASGRDELQMLASRFGVAADRLRVALTPIDVDTLQPVCDRTAACRELGLDPARRHLVFMGRFDTVKRLDVIVDVFARLAGDHPDVDLVLAGSGKGEERLRELAASAGPGRVKFVGWVSEPERKAALYGIGELLVLASRREGFPTVVGEAMACGTPVLAPRIGGVPELVTEGETGWTFPPEDDEAFARRLAWALDHPDDLRALRPRARSAALARVAPPVVAAALRECFATAGVALGSQREALH